MFILNIYFNFGYIVFMLIGITCESSHEFFCLMLKSEQLLCLAGERIMGCFSNLSKISKQSLSLNSRLIFASNCFPDLISDIHFPEVMFVAVKDCTE